jgi:hypothetical protein
MKPLNVYRPAITLIAWLSTIELKAMCVRKLWIAVSNPFISAFPLRFIGTKMPGLRAAARFRAQPRLRQVWHPKSRQKLKKRKKQEPGEKS